VASLRALRRKTEQKRKNIHILYLFSAVKVVVGAGVTVAGAVVGGPPGAAVGAAVAGAILEE
jgi:hypothetical protein